MDIAIIGGGAAGFFAAITCAEANPDCRVTIFERGKSVLEKVRVSGGGRCNVTHHCFDARTLVQHYPRGSRELLAPFLRFGPEQTVDWFERRGVRLKAEADGRMFPVTDDSQTIMDCLQRAARRAGVQVRLGARVAQITPDAAGWQLQVPGEPPESFAKLLVATGSSTAVWDRLRELGHHIVAPVPSLFTFNTKDTRLRDLSGLSVPQAQLRLPGARLQAQGPLLVTHWGLSGPAVLRLSAWGARELLAHAPFMLPLRLWQRLCAAAGLVEEGLRWADLDKARLQQLAQQLTAATFQIAGKSTFKEEFVTAGGVQLKELNFKTFESRLHPGLYLAGEVLDIDAITGDEHKINYLLLLC